MRPEALDAIVEADIRDPALQQTLPKGVGFIHSGMKVVERRQ